MISIDPGNIITLAAKLPKLMAYSIVDATLARSFMSEMAVKVVTCFNRDLRR